MTTTNSPERFGMEYGLHLHERCLAGEVTAFADVYYAYVVPLAAAVKQEFRGYFDESQFEEAALHALMSYFENFSRYKPTRGISLFAFLLMAAKGDFRNLRQRDHRQLQNQDPLVVEDDDGERELELKDPQYEAFEVRLLHDESIVWEDIARILPDDRDRYCAYMILQNERSSEVYVEIYDLAHLSPEEREHEVKKHKDRVKRRLQRKLDREDYRVHD